MPGKLDLDILNKEMIGKKYNSFTVLEVFRINKKIKCKCLCDCGNITEVRKSRVMSEKNKGCRKCTPSKTRTSLGKKNILLAELNKSRLGIKRPEHSIKMLGNKNPNFKNPEDRTTYLNKQIRYSDKYKKWRKDIFDRDKYKCQECGIGSVWLEVHHIKRLSIILKENNIKSKEQSFECKELWYLKNGVTLCKKCHDNYRRISNG
jgi:hypothetical protein